LAEAALNSAGDVSGPIIELGAAAGGVTRALAERFDTPVLGLDLSAPLVRFATRALRGGRLRYPLRLSGTAYADREILVPPPSRGSATMWLADALVPPVAAGHAGLVVALNLLDCVADPAVLLQSAAGLLRPGGHLLLATPCDWNAGATPPEAWIGARSCAAAAPDLAAWTVSLADLELVAKVSGQSWNVRVHTRAYMKYEVDLLVLRRSKISI
jgi:SAM-dependent methyltransferase